MTITTRALIRGTAVGHQFVLECDHHANTNRLGRVQRAIIDYLGTAPEGLTRMPSQISSAIRGTTG